MSLADAHTGILTTLRADGTPVPTPVWFVVEGKAVLVAGPAATVKVARVRADPRVSFLVESGHRWDELRAVRVDGTAEVVDSPDWVALDAAFDEKYGAFRTPRAEMAPSAQRRYDAARVLVRVVPSRRLVSWDNSRLSQ